MLTIFTTPKPLNDENRWRSFSNAMGSWLQIKPKPEILVFTKQPCLLVDEIDEQVHQIADFECGSQGLPFVDDMFIKAQERASNDILMYTNDDMIYMSDLMPAIIRVQQKFPEFFMVGQRWDVPIPGYIDFSDPKWEILLHWEVLMQGELHPPGGKDYFIFTGPLPFRLWPMFVGRPKWDDMLLYLAKQHQMPTVDLTRAVAAIHQEHDYNHVPGSDHPNRTQPWDWRHNQQMFRERGGINSATDSTKWILTDDLELIERRKFNNG